MTNQSSRQAATEISKAELNQIGPGDEVLVKIPAADDDADKAVWGWVLNKKCADNEIWIVVDHGLVMNKNPKYHDNSVVKVFRENVQRRIQANTNSPTVLISTYELDDSFLDARRVDGKMNSIIIQINRGDFVSFYKVDHLGKTKV